ncbi:MAG: desulfoferrodoxin [Candidatus Altiarchaeales archaeon ex4484_2]|nr:MAG: desulfoferrodoxin [Candidatus Altiarchaeales archaeon ex4484_2]
MTELNQIYRCNICGNITEVLHSGAGELVCCNQPMELLEARTGDEGYEKHVPVIEETSNGFRVKVGSTPHPMEDNHFITLIELLADGQVYRGHLKPGDKPEAVFRIKASRLSAREYCNIHGLWSSK